MSVNGKFRQEIYKLYHEKKMEFRTTGTVASFGTERNRLIELKALCKDLKSVGYKDVTAKNFRTEHIEKLVLKYKADGLSTGTIKNKMTHIRWLAEKLNKGDIVPKTNKELNIPYRKFSDNSKNIAKNIDKKLLNKLSQRQQLSIRLQREFGLRRQESIKFTPAYAIKNDYITLKPSWTKGGRARNIAITNKKQIELLKDITKFCGNGSLVNKNSNYIKTERLLDKSCQRIGMTNNHGYRHMYAQSRFKELTGYDCPKVCNNGIASSLNLVGKAKDKEARLIISRELGHNREEITVNYLGR